MGIGKYDEYYSMNPNSFKCLEQYVDNFKKIDEVITDIEYNNPNNVVNPLFTIIIPTYNRTDLFKETLNSALLQDLKDVSWDILVIDNTPLNDKKTTYAYEIIKDNNYPNVSYVHNSANIGPGYNWNRGALLARGKWIVFVHDDDLLYKDALSVLNTIIQSKTPITKRLGFITNDFRSERFKDKQLYCRKLTHAGALIHGYSRANTPSCGTCILKQAYFDTGGINYDFGPTADAIFAYNMMNNYDVYLCEAPLGKYRWIDNATKNSQVLEQLIKSDELFADYRYKKNWIGKVWGFFFSNTISEMNIEGKQLINDGLEEKTNFNNCVRCGYGLKDNKLLRILYQFIVSLYDCYCSLKRITIDYE